MKIVSKIELVFLTMTQFIFRIIWSLLALDIEIYVPCNGWVLCIYILVLCLIFSNNENRKSNKCYHGNNHDIVVLSSLGRRPFHFHKEISLEWSESKWTSKSPWVIEWIAVNQLLPISFSIIQIYTIYKGICTYINFVAILYLNASPFYFKRNRNLSSNRWIDSSNFSSGIKFQAHWKHRRVFEQSRAPEYHLSSLKWYKSWERRCCDRKIKIPRWRGNS